MALVYVVATLLVGAVAGVAEPDAAIISHRGSAFFPTTKPRQALGFVPAYHPSPFVTPAYGAIPPYHAVTPAYGGIPPPFHAYPPSSYHAAFKCRGYDKVPACFHNTTKPWCLYDHEYPEYEIKDALRYHKTGVLPLYADVVDLGTASSTDRPLHLDEESYLCPYETSYIRPLRAINTDGQWRIIVNNIHEDYETFTQTVRLEECISYTTCPLVPHCYESKCLQKSLYQRFLVYDPCDQYFPFSIETFKLPASCSCLLGAIYLDY
nr:uncharacterized protein LOC128689638 [Cherax quadricarinatus]